MPALPCLALPSLAMPCLAAPCRAMPALSCPARPCHAQPRQASRVSVRILATMSDRPILELDRHDSDWIRRGPLDLPPELLSAEGLRGFLDAIGMTVANFKRQQAYKANVERLPWLRDL